MFIQIFRDICPTNYSIRRKAIYVTEIKTLVDAQYLQNARNFKGFVQNSQYWATCNSISRNLVPFRDFTGVYPENSDVEQKTAIIFHDFEIW